MRHNTRVRFFETRCRSLY